MAATPCRPYVVRPRDQDDPYDDAHPKGENSAKMQKTSKHGTFVLGESSSGQDYESEPGPSTSGNQDQSNDFDFWINSYATDDDDVILNEKVSQELVDEISQIVDEAKLRKVINEMLRQQCTSGDEHQHHIDQMQNFLKSDIIVQIIKTYWELGHEHKFITEIVARRANGCIMSITDSDYKNLNKNDIKDMYLLIINHKVDDYAETGLSWSLSVFIMSIVIWERVHNFQLGVESYQQQVNLTAPRITFPAIKKYKVFSIVSEPVYGIIYKNNKKEKRVMRHQEVHKFCDATLKTVLEGLKSYNNDVKYGYVTHNLSKEDVEYLQLFAEEIEERLKYQVPEIYMHQFWFTINKHDSSYRFKIGKKRFTLNMEVFREIFQICPKLSNQEFDALPSDEEIVSFIKELGHKGDIKSVSDAVVDHMHQPWRTFASIINKCLSGKITGLDKMRLSRDQII
ncbi:hypothetical protein Tco_0282526 [Tanacetum coccineum]